MRKTGRAEAKWFLSFRFVLHTSVVEGAQLEVCEPQAIVLLKSWGERTSIHDWGYKNWACILLIRSRLFILL